MELSKTIPTTTDFKCIASDAPLLFSSNHDLIFKTSVCKNEDLIEIHINGNCKQTAGFVSVSPKKNREVVCHKAFTNKCVAVFV